jgi:hypothetical protein
MWPLTVALGLVIAYFILKFAMVKDSVTGNSYYKSGPKVNPSPYPGDDALIGVGLETRISDKKNSVMDPGYPAKMVMLPPQPAPPMMGSSQSSMPPMMGSSPSSMPPMMMGSSPSSMPPMMMGSSPSGMPPMMGSSPSGMPPMMGSSPSGMMPPMMGSSPSGMMPPMMGSSPSGMPPMMGSSHGYVNLCISAFNT